MADKHKQPNIKRVAFKATLAELLKTEIIAEDGVSLPFVEALAKRSLTLSVGEAKGGVPCFELHIGQKGREVLLDVGELAFAVENFFPRNSENRERILDAAASVWLFDTCPYCGEAGIKRLDTVKMVAFYEKGDEVAQSLEVAFPASSAKIGEAYYCGKCKKAFGATASHTDGEAYLCDTGLWPLAREAAL